jgi:hypothetical protein
MSQKPQIKMKVIKTEDVSLSRVVAELMRRGMITFTLDDFAEVVDDIVTEDLEDEVSFIDINYRDLANSIPTIMEIKPNELYVYEPLFILLN